MTNKIIPFRRPTFGVTTVTPENCAAKCFRDVEPLDEADEKVLAAIRGAFTCEEHGLIAEIDDELRAAPELQETQEWFWRSMGELAQARKNKDEYKGILVVLANALDMVSKGMLSIESDNPAMQRELLRCAVNAKRCSEDAMKYLGRMS